MEKKWIVKDKIGEVDSELQEKFHPIVLQILANRGLLEKEKLEKFFTFDYEKDVLDPFLFHDMEKAVERIVQAKKNKEKIGIFGDYDADGVTSTAVIFETLTALGFSGMEIYIPDRQTEGYGMNIEAIKKLQANGVNLIITVDCGITNIDEVAFAKENGIDVLITCLLYTS